MKQRIKGDDQLDDSVRAFLELGGERNRLVHEDFGTFTLEKTTEEIHALYSRAMRFVARFRAPCGNSTPTAPRRQGPDRASATCDTTCSIISS